MIDLSLKEDTGLSLRKRGNDNYEADNAKSTTVPAIKTNAVQFSKNTATATSVKTKLHARPAAISTTEANTHGAQNNNDSYQKSMFPADWWNLEYPSHTVAVPSRNIVEHLYVQALQERAEQEDSPLRVTDSEISSLSHQAQLDELGVGLLSLEEVLIPAVAHEEATTLRTFQSKVQRQYKPSQKRDGDVVEVEGGDVGATSTAKQATSDLTITPDVGAMVQECRRVFFNSVSAAIRSTRAARLVREEQLALEKAQQAQARQQQQEQQQHEQARLREMEQSRQRRELKLKLPQNHELWREVAYLTSGLNKLQKEERLWKDMEIVLDREEQELDQQEQGLKLKQQERSGDNTMKAAANTLTEAANLLDGVQELDRRLDQLVASATNLDHTVHSALQYVSNVLHETELVEKELYSKYRQCHLFRDLKSVRNPTDLIKNLSQDL